MSLRLKALIEKERQLLSPVGQALCDSFLTCEKPVFGVATSSAKRHDPPIVRQNLIDLSEGKPFLPIEQFKWHPLEAASHMRTTRTFLSSGTTSKDRSRSSFSDEGLRLYKLCALRAFSEMMTQMLGPEWDELGGISLVPSVAVWPDSSLAQMVAWIAEVTPVHFATVDDLADVLHGEAKTRWIFGTALHFMQTLRGSPVVVTPDSLLIETGGTKGLESEMTRADFYHALGAHYGLDEQRIVSEYGMCELASQAYDYVHAENLGLRKYLFPHWVSSRVEQSDGALHERGQGCLAIYDPFRIDYPLYLRTQDYVNVEESGGFVFKGRLVGAPLKGCSLRAEQVLAADSTAIVPMQKQASRRIVDVRPAVDLDAFAKKFCDFLERDDVCRSLASETGSASDAKYLLQTIKMQLPQNWRESLLRTKPSAQHWLFILPQNHSIAGLYPLIFAAALGLRVHIRRAKPEAQTPFFNLVLGFLLDIVGVKWTILPHTYRVNGPSSLPDGVEAVLCYGTDATIERLRSCCGLPVQGFGETLNTGLVSSSDLSKSYEGIVKDAFALGQQGCRSLRYLVVQHANEPSAQNYKAWSEGLRDAFTNYWGHSLDEQIQLALQHEALRYRTLFGAHTELSNGTPLFVFMECDHAFDTATFLSPVPFCLPILLFRQSQNDAQGLLQKMKTSTPSLQVLTDFGHAQSLPWDGLHDKRSLFNV